MINYLQNNSSLGTQNFLQQQATLTRVPEDIRTHNAEQVATRNVEQAANAPNAKETDPDGDKDQEKKEDDKNQAMIPPPPSRFQLQVQENTERVNKTQQAVTQFFLSAATSTAMLGEQAGGRAEQANAQRMSVDVVA